MKKILVIDDYQLFRNMIECFFSDAGYEVRTACDGGSGLDIMHEFLPDVVILDVMMPDMSGLEVLNEMHQYDTLRNIPVIIATGSSFDEQMRVRILQKQNCRDLIPKDTDLQKIMELVNKAMESAGRPDDGSIWSVE